MNLVITILAGGAGKRMMSNLPKVLHKVGSLPMIVHLLNTSLELKPNRINIVVSKNFQIIKNEIEQYIDNNIISYIIQKNPLGTGDAVKTTLPFINKSKETLNLILNGDCPLLKKTTLESIINNYININSELQITCINIDNPFGNGRIIKNQNKVIEIVEEKDATPEQRNITLVNCGIYITNNYMLNKLIPMIQSNNIQSEFYLTDIVSLYNKEYPKYVDFYELEKSQFIEIYNINTQEQLSYINSVV